jgi:hypothetical protein
MTVGAPSERIGNLERDMTAGRAPRTGQEVAK